MIGVRERRKQRALDAKLREYKHLQNLQKMFLHSQLGLTEEDMPNDPTEAYMLIVNAFKERTEALQSITEQETPSANATVRRIVKIAKDALKIK